MNEPYDPDVHITLYIYNFQEKKEKRIKDPNIHPTIFKHKMLMWNRKIL